VALGPSRLDYSPLKGPASGLSKGVGIEGSEIEENEKYKNFCIELSDWSNGRRPVNFTITLLTQTATLIVWL
jgi:hypothetical protein